MNSVHKYEKYLVHCFCLLLLLFSVGAGCSGKSPGGVLSKTMKALRTKDMDVRMA
ncbi:hypothetical protein ACFL27_14025 [candidate division CSSED10-310 bacterium]|uniref:Uncharacterized protein n=1 Tax=candidate division CSSED10-310 bacterium TaxID=2855610 RepID=A0ABV6YYN6_UNCC1